MKMLKEEFKNPGKEFRAAPFWSWNDDLKDRELQHQIDEMKKGGLGGFFMHSRVGLITPYFSKQWMERIKNTVAYSKKEEMLAYLYDEDRWPSGFAGGKIPKKGKDYRNQGLELTKKNKKWAFRKVIGERLLQFNNETYVDTLNPRVIKSFIDSTYEKYFKEVGKEFDKTIPGIFTDEPNCNTWRGVNKKNIPWTDNLPEKFKERYGYEITNHLLSLFFNLGNYKKIRYHYWRLVAELFLEAYTKQIYHWCDKHKIAYTGHYNAEDTLLSQMTNLGAAMPHYEYMHIPGVDHLGRNIDNLITLKQCSSVAHQLSKERVLSELYGCSGQNFSLEGRKWIGDWHIVLGVNLFCPHLWLYSMKGCRKRDYPPTLSFQQPYWKYNKPIEDYFARLSYIMSQGEFIADILVLHPVESAWCLYKPSDTKEVDKLNNSFVALTKDLGEIHGDYDLGDESLLEKYGKVEKDIFKVGKMKYRLVIIPPAVTLRRSTINLLSKFLANGGEVIAIRPLASLMEAEENKKLKELWKKVKVISQSKEELKKALDELLEREISIKEAGKEVSSIYYQHRRVEKKEIYFLANTDQKRKYNSVIKIKGKGRLEEWDPLTGETEEIPASYKNGKTIFNLFFPETGSHLLVLDKSKLAQDKSCGYRVAAAFRLREKGTESKSILSDNWEFKRLNSNAVTLDYTCYKKKGARNWSKKIPVREVQQSLEKEGKVQNISLRFGFQADFSFSEKIYLILENPSIFRIKVNDKKIKYQDKGFWIDPSFRKIDISKAIKKKGKNFIELSCLFKSPAKPRTLIYKKDGVELESIYLIGDFKVEGRFKKERDIIRGKDFILKDRKGVRSQQSTKSKGLVTQGYPFYAGSFLFSQKFKLHPHLVSSFPSTGWEPFLEGEDRKGGKIFLKFENFNTIIAKVTVNKKEAGLVFWPPYQVEVTNFLKKGENLLEIELTNSLRNLLGPHHHRAGELLSVGPGSFTDRENWTDNYSFIPFGQGKVRLVKYGKIR